MAKWFLNGGLWTKFRSKDARPESGRGQLGDGPVCFKARDLGSLSVLRFVLVDTELSLSNRKVLDV